jgi:glyoxylase-like metal-dependent hydrolase (beta-lactamase superfamily II)
MSKLLCTFMVLVLAVLLSPRASMVRAADPEIRITEEGQRVIYERFTWLRRELAKRLPLDQPWPGPADIDSYFARYGVVKNAPAEQIPVPVKLAPHVYLVGSSDALTYLIDCGQGNAAIVDPGFEKTVPGVLDVAEKLGFPSSHIRWILNTHSHGDHTQGNAAILERTGAQLMIGAADAPAIENPASRPPQPQPKGSASAGAAPAASRQPMPASVPVKVHRLLQDNEELRLGERLLRVISVPGHTPGSMVFLLESDGKKLLLSGDVALFDYRLPAMGMRGTNNQQYAEAMGRLVKTLSGNRPDLLLPGHGTIVLEKAYMDLIKCCLMAEHNVANGEPISASPFPVPLYRALMFGRP